MLVSRFCFDKYCLRGGDDWRKRIYDWMDQAHGAVVLLSEEALKSNFVPIELAVLSFRHYREQKFPLIPVLVGNVQPEDTRSGFISDIDLSKIQFIRGLKPAGAAREVVTAFRGFLTKYKPRTARVDSRERNVFSPFARNLLQVDFETACKALCELVQRWPIAAAELSQVLELAYPLLITEIEAAAIAELVLQ